MRNNFLITIMIVLFWEMRGFPFYKLYQEPSYIGRITTTAKQSTYVTVEKQNLIFQIQTYDSILTVDCYRYYGSKIQYSEQMSMDTFIQMQSLHQVSWIWDEYLLMVGSKSLVFYRPPIIDKKNQTIRVKNNNTFYYANIVSQANKIYLTTIEKMSNNYDWFLIKYQIKPYEKSFVLDMIGYIKIKEYKYDLTLKITATKHFDCVIFQSPDQNRIYCYNFNTKKFHSWDPGYQYLITVTTNQLSDDVYIILRKNSKQTSKTIKYSLSEDGSYMSQTEVFNFTKIFMVYQMKVYQNQLIMIASLPEEKCSQFLIILQKNIEQAFVKTQYVAFSKQYCSIDFLQKMNSKIIILGRQQFSSGNKIKFDATFTTYINYNDDYIYVFTFASILAILLIIITIKSLSTFPVCRQLFFLEKRHVSFVLEILFIFLIHGGIIYQNSVKNKSVNGIFTHQASRSTSQGSFQVKMYQTMFLFTSIVSILFEASNQFKIKSTYLNFLTKQGLKIQNYLYFRQLMIILKLSIYAMTSFGVFYLLQNSQSDFNIKLFPSIEQYLTAVIAYFFCLFSLHNLAFLFVYYCSSNWFLIQILFSSSFLISFISNQWYLNKDFTFIQKILACISPTTLFLTIVEYTFKIESRLNGNIQFYFLIGVLFLQSLIALTLFNLYFFNYFKETSFDQLVVSEKKRQMLLINASQNSESFTIRHHQDSIDQPLLRAYIPRKLSTNKGFQKINILKDIRFTGNKGEIITFLDSENISKRTLFQILINNQKSDSHIEKDLEGEIVYSQPIKLSFVLNERTPFSQLSIYQRLQLISTLRNPWVPKNQRKKELEFILNEFNIPDEFRNMPSSQLSGGYQKKAALACAFVGNPDVVIIDEPSLGLDIRFKNVLYRKLAQWKHDKLIILGTSDQTEAESVSDRIWTLQNGKAINSNTECQKFITQIRLSFQSLEKFLQAKKLLFSRFNNQKIIMQNECKEEKNDYKIKLTIYSEDHESQKQIKKTMLQLSQEFDFSGNQIFLNFKITEHPFDESSLLPFRESPNSPLNELTYKDIELYRINRALEVNSDDEVIQSNQQLKNEMKRKTNKLLQQLSHFQKKSSLYYSQFMAIVNFHKYLWKGRQLKKELLIVSLFSWIHNLIWFKINRPLQNYDFVNLLISYCFLHFSLIEMRIAQQSKQTRSSTLVKINTSILFFSTWIFDFLYITIGFISNLLAQVLIINIIFLAQTQYILSKVFCSILYIACYSLSISLLTKLFQSMAIVSSFLYVTHVAFIQASFNSFTTSFQTIGFDINNILQFLYYPLSIMNLYEKSVSDQSCWIYLISIFSQIGFLIVLAQLISLLSVQKSQKKNLKNYKNVHNESIDTERVFIDNIKDSSAAPIICDNIIHFYITQAVIKNFTLHVNLGQISGLLGHNSCGKTTALKIIAGQLIQTFGSVHLNGLQTNKNSSNYLLQVGYCPQNGLLEEEITVEQNIRFAGQLKGLQTNYVTKFMIKFFRYFRLKNIERVKVKYLSQSQRKKVSLIVALLGFPKVVLFDEITSGVDLEGREKMLNVIKSYSEEHKGTVLLTSHQISQVEDICDRVHILKQGILKKCGQPYSLRSQPQHQLYLLIAYFKTGQQGSLQIKKSKIKEYILSLNFVKFQCEQNHVLAYSLDIRKINVIEVWQNIYDEFYLHEIIEKFTFGRHGLPQVVKYSISESQIKDDWQYGSKIDDNNDALRERLI